jgi:hypothetical protein
MVDLFLFEFLFVLQNQQHVHDKQDVNYFHLIDELERFLFESTKKKQSF